MAMKIWHQSFTVLQKLGPYNDAMRDHLKKVARPDTEIVMHGMHVDTYQTNYPGNDIRYAGFQYLHGLQWIAAGLRAEELGYDAYAIATLPDPAIREIRSLLQIPVAGYGEAAMFTACSLGRRFGTLVFITELAPLLEEKVALNGLSGRFVGVRDVGFRFNDVLAAYGGDVKPLIEKFRVAARALIREGADAIIPGEAPLCVLLASNGIAEVDGVPVVDALGAWVRQAEALVDMRRTTGHQHSRKGFWHEPPPRDRVRELAKFYGLDKFFKDAK